MDPAARLVTDAVRTTRAVLLKINRLENDLNSITVANQAFERRLSVYEPPRGLDTAAVPLSTRGRRPVAMPSPPPARKGMSSRRSVSVSLPTLGEVSPSRSPPLEPGRSSLRLMERSPQGVQITSPTPTQQTDRTSMGWSYNPLRTDPTGSLRSESPPTSPGSSLAAHRIDCLEYLLGEEKNAHQVSPEQHTVDTK